MPFTPAQQSAIDSRSRELLVSAAAGSGKTAVLVERILSLIQQDGLSIDRMLIVTFTRAAAGEMRERLETRLMDAAQGEPRLQRQADLVPSAQISTIHSFCQKAVREHFQHCGIDPQFSLCDERTRAAFEQESMEETLNWLYAEAANDSELTELARKFTERDTVSMLQSLYRFLLSRPDPMAWLNQHASHVWRMETLDQEPMSQAFCREAMLIIEGMLSLWHECEEAAHQPVFPEKYLPMLHSDGEVLRSLARACETGITHLMEALSNLKFMTLAVFKPTTSDEAAAANFFKETRNRYKKMVDELKKLLPEDIHQAVEDLQRMAPASRGLAKAMRFYHETFSQKKREMTVIDFNDLEHMTLSILRKPELQHQLCRRFDAIFVDEYQDVSELQEAILNALKRPADDPQKQYCFYVGDVKQSIYRFRLAEPGLFLRKLSAFSPEDGAEERKIILNRNFRSREGVLSSVNRVFEHVMDSRVTEIDYDDDAKLYPGIPSKNDPETELHVFDSHERRPQEMILAEAEWIARDIERTIGQPVTDREGSPAGLLHYRDIAILLPVSKNIADQVEMVLTQHGIPVYAEGTADVLGAEEVQQVIQYLTVLDNLMNDVALLSVLRSPVFDMTEQELSAVRMMKPEREASFLTALMHAAENAEEPLRSRCADVIRTLENERFTLSAMPMSDYLWDFLMRSGLYAHYGAQPGGRLRQANLRMLCSRALDYEKSHPDGLHGFVESLAMEGPAPENSPSVLSPWEDVVRIMTIHKSKGLEFPTVYVMNLGRSLFGRAQSRALSVHGEAGFAIGYVNEEARTRRMTLLQGAIALKEKNAERAERARLLYVALTRPKNRLVMLGSASGVQMNFDAMLDSFARGAKDVYAVRSAKSMLDWVLQCVSPHDFMQEVSGAGFSTDQIRKTHEQSMFSTESTCFPQKNALWRVVFHINPEISRAKSSRTAMVSDPLPLVETVENPLHLPSPSTDLPDPLAPAIAFSPLPLKVGVTALCRAMEEGTDAEDEEENEDTKRMPMPVSQPKMMSAAAAMPSFLMPKEENRALAVGVQTHRMLGLISLDAVRPVAEKGKALYAVVCREAERLTESGIMTPAEASFVDRGMVCRFLESPLGLRMLASSEVHREWPFNLRVQEPFATIVQGVIDLCFLEEGGWVLVDFKTDRVEKAQDLWPMYRRQLSFYRDALAKGTPHPVKEACLFALRLGESVAENDL